MCVYHNAPITQGKSSSRYLRVCLVGGSWYLKITFGNQKGKKDLSFHWNPKFPHKLVAVILKCFMGIRNSHQNSKFLSLFSYQIQFLKTNYHQPRTPLLMKEDNTSFFTIQTKQNLSKMSSTLLPKMRTQM